MDSRDYLRGAVVLGPRDAQAGETAKRIFVADVGPIVPPDGKERNLSLDDLRQIKANFDREAGRGRAAPVPIDIEHSTLRAPLDKSRGAIGWGTGLELDEEEGVLWAVSSWNTEDDADLIRKKRFRFTSPVLQFNHKDFESGADVGTRLHSIAVTNQPISPRARPMMAASEFLHKEPPMKLVKITLADTEYEVPEAVAEAISAKPAEDTETAEKLTAAEAKVTELTEALALAEKAKPAADAVVLSADEWNETKAKADRGEKAALALEALEATNRIEKAVGEGRLTAAEAKEEKFLKAAQSEDDWSLVLSLRAPDSAWTASGVKGGASRVEEGNEDPRQRLDTAVKTLIASEAAAGNSIDYAEALARVRRDPASKTVIEAAV